MTSSENQNMICFILFQTFKNIIKVQTIKLQCDYVSVVRWEEGQRERARVKWRNHNYSNTCGHNKIMGEGETIPIPDALIVPEDFTAIFLALWK